MADTIRDKFFEDLAKGARWDVGVSIARGNPLPLDANSVFASYEALETYAAGVLAYPGQLVAVVNENSTGIYYLDQNKAIMPVGVIPSGDEMSIEMDENDVISLHDFGKAFYKYVPEEGETPAHYERVEVSETALWKSGLEPKVVNEDGKLVIGWFEPNPTTIEGVNNQVTAVQGAVDVLETSVEGISKDVEEVQADVDGLIDTIGSSEDALEGEVNTVWAHINDQAGRLEELEKFDHSAYALQSDLEKEIKRAGDAEKANADAIKAISDDYLKAEHKEALENSINGAVERIEAIEEDYLVAADIAGMATNDSVAEAVRVEKERAELAEQGLQNQINTILSNPDAEGAINSINEFTQYIAEHGEIAEGFRTDIDENASAISGEITRATAAEGLLSGRLDVLEAIDHDAYVSAIASAKTELEGKINLKADKTALESAIEDFESAESALDLRLVEVEEALAEEGSVAQAIAAAEGRAAADAESKANAAKQAAIDDAATKYATTEALEALDLDVDSRLQTLEAYDHATYATKTELASVEQTANNASTAVGNLETRFDEIVAVGGEPNAINKIQVNGSDLAITNKTVNIAVPTKFSDLTDDSGFDGRITAAKSQADKGVSDAAAAQSKAEENKGLIDAQALKITALETAKEGHDTSIADHLSRIVVLENAKTAHEAEYSALEAIVSGHTTALSGKADKSALETVSGNVATNASAIKTLNEVTIPGINDAIALKADASSLENFYEKSEVEGLIEAAKEEVAYDDTAVKGLISSEEARAKAAEKANADEIARVNAVLVGALENNEEGLDSIKELASWIETHGAAAEGMVEAIEANTEEIAKINNAETGILAVAKKYTDDQIAGLPAATASALGLVKFDDDTIKMNENQQLYVNKVSTDILVQGLETLILNGGSAKE